MKNRLFIICGHYGTGKTLVSLNMALELKKKIGDSTLSFADLDIVNPYFRSADAAKLLTDNGIDTIIPEFANTNVDIPSIPAELRKVFDTDTYAVLDVGGDDSGAIVLGAYNEEIIGKGYELFIVVNRFRPFIETPLLAAQMVQQIEASSRLAATGIINNSNLACETSKEDILSGVEYAREICRLTSLPLIFNTAPKFLEAQFTDTEKKDFFFVDNLTKKFF